MKKLAAILCLSALATGAFAQGLINFGNTSSTLISSGSGAGSALPGSAPATYWFGVFTAPAGTTDPNSAAWSFAGVYGTNTAASGRINGGVGIQVAGWAPGTTRAFLVRGWSENLGTTWNPAWLTGNFAVNGFYGTSAVGSGVAGGFDGTGNLPNLNLFGAGATQIGGFNLGPVTGVVPEPTTFALAGLGAAALLIFRRRK